MKLRDFVFFLLLFVDLPLSSMTRTDCKSSAGSEIGLTMALRITDILASLGGVPNPLSPLWIALDLKSSSDPFQQLVIKCNIQKYHSKKVFQYLKNREQDISYHSNNLLNLEKIRIEIESAHVMQEILTNDVSTRVAVYPLLMHWAAGHLKVYKHMIHLIGRERAYLYMEKHDEWVVYYVQLVLRYWRPYKKNLLMWNSGDYSSHSVIQNPAEKLLLKWIEMPFNQSHQRNISRMLDSCKVKKGGMVMFNTLKRVLHVRIFMGLFITKKWRPVGIKTHGVGERWWSCHNSNHEFKLCTTRTCPSGYGYKNPFNYNSGLRDWDCKGEVFWIYSDSAEIKNGHTVNIKYKYKYWVSTINRDGEPSNIERCPGTSFHSINRACSGENIRVSKKKIRFSQEVIYDGNLITLCRTGKNCRNVMDIYYHGAETLKYEVQEKPKREFWEEYLQKVHNDSLQLFYICTSVFIGLFYSKQ